MTSGSVMDWSATWRPGRARVSDGVGEHGCEEDFHFVAREGAVYAEGPAALEVVVDALEAE